MLPFRLGAVEGGAYGRMDAAPVDIGSCDVSMHGASCQRSKNENSSAGFKAVGPNQGSVVKVLCAS